MFGTQCGSVSGGAGRGKMEEEAGGSKEVQKQKCVEMGRSAAANLHDAEAKLGVEPLG